MTRDDRVLIVSFGTAVAADFAAFVTQSSRGDAVVVADPKIRECVDTPIRTLSMPDCLGASPDVWSESGRPTSLILFLGSSLTERERRDLEDLLGLARQWNLKFVGVISSFRVHLDEPGVSEVENQVHARARQLGARVVVFRPGHVLSRHSETTRLIRRFTCFYPLIPKWIRTCFLEGTELFVAIERERLGGDRLAGPEESGFAAGVSDRPTTVGRAVGGASREITVLGSNRSWREMLAPQRAQGLSRSLATAVITLLSWLLLGQLIGLVLSLLARYVPGMRQCHVSTLKPRSMCELLSLCHRDNIGHVKVVGYNNGVVHFGHRYPGKTIVSTVRCRRTILAGPHTLKADCGATIRAVLDFLAMSDQDLHVVPNYSYVSVGTSYFVPIHGSAVDYSTVADTICKVLLYDPDRDRIISATRADLDFIENIYNLKSHVVVLRLYLRAKPKASYFVQRATLVNPTASDLLSALRDRDATNVEIRQSHAANAKVNVSRYYKDPGSTSGPALELPRDALGRLWDRLEENRVSSFLMHALSRHLAWHTELFFTPRDFDQFWKTHAQVPLRKIQLRYIHRDGMPHSPFRDEDCVSADLFLFRWNKSRFEAYLQRTFSRVRTNPGKHSN